MGDEKASDTRTDDEDMLIFLERHSITKDMFQEKFKLLGESESSFWVCLIQNTTLDHVSSRHSPVRISIREDLNAGKIFDLPGGC